MTESLYHQRAEEYSQFMTERTYSRMSKKITMLTHTNEELKNQLERAYNSQDSTQDSVEFLTAKVAEYEAFLQDLMQTLLVKDLQELKQSCELNVKIVSEFMNILDVYDSDKIVAEVRKLRGK